MQNNPFSLNNKSILVTGASSGIGRQLAINISKMGGKVIINGRNVERLQETFHSLHPLEDGEHEYFVADLTDEVAIKNLISQLPTLNGLAYSSGIVHPFPIKFLAQKHINNSFNINHHAAVLLTSLLLQRKKIADHASMVFVSSIAGQNPYKGGAMYAASKAALEAFAKTMALEYAHKGIRANCVSPAMVKTPIYDMVAKNTDEQKMIDHTAKYPLGIGTPDDVANSIIFLLSDASKWITGINLRLDGGLLIGVQY